MEGKLEHEGTIFLYSSGMPDDLVEKSKSRLVKMGVLETNIRVITVPEDVPEGAIMVTVWPHYLSVAKVKKVREGSIYAPQLFNINF
jgi:hypothetical protein